MSQCAEDKPLLLFSFGGGVQSTALALLALNRDERFIPDPENHHMVFLYADTGAERRRTYQHIWQMADWITSQGWRFEVVRKSWEDLDEDLIARHAEGRGGIAAPPFFLSGPGERGQPMRRSCTADWKVVQLDRMAKRLRKEYGKDHAHRIFGISNDERRRMRAAPDQDNSYLYPLIESMGWTRWHCDEYIKKVATYPDGTPLDVPRSSCVFCPFHSKEEWREVKADPDDWQRALRLDDLIEQAAAENKAVAGLPAHKIWLTKNGVRLRDADFSATPTDQLEIFGEDRVDMDNDCAHHCGV